MNTLNHSPALFGTGTGGDISPQHSPNLLRLVANVILNVTFKASSVDGGGYESASGGVEVDQASSHLVWLVMDPNLLAVSGKPLARSIGGITLP